MGLIRVLAQAAVGLILAKPAGGSCTVGPQPVIHAPLVSRIHVSVFFILLDLYIAAT